MKGFTFHRTITVKGRSNYPRDYKCVICINKWSSCCDNERNLTSCYVAVIPHNDYTSLYIHIADIGHIGMSFT